jgi:signal transduction histidine kinase
MSDEPSSVSTVNPKRNHWMDVALGVLWLLCGWVIAERLWVRHETFRLTVFIVSSVAYLLLTAGLLATHYARRRYQGYFLHQLLILTLMVYAARNTGQVWFLFLPAASQAVMFLPARKMIVVLCAQLIVGCFPLVYAPANYVLSYLVSYGTAFLFAMGCSYAIRREQESRQKLHVAHEQLRLYAQQAEALAVAEERNRISREIHDGVAHHLTSGNVLIEAGLALLPPGSPPAAIDSLQKAQQQVRSALSELRESIAGRQKPDFSVELPQRIAKLITDGNFPATLSVRGGPRRLAPETEQALFRVAQEALTNAGKHAPGRAIRLSLDFSETARVRLDVENEAAPQGGSGDGSFGLLSLGERMRRVGGTFHAGAERSGLFVVRAEIPS